MNDKEVIIWLDHRWYDALTKHLKDETLEEHAFQTDQHHFP